MAIIDLGSGEVDKPENITPPVGRIIDLDSGEFIEDAVPVEVSAEVQQVAPVEPAQPLSEIIPEAIESIPSLDVPETGIGDVFTGSERIAATPELGTLPEFFTTAGSGKAMGILSTFDTKAQMDIIQEAIPEAVFETTPDGSTIIEVPTKDGGTRRSVLNRPGFSPQDVTTGIAQLAAFIPSAKAANLGKTLLRKVGIGTVAAGATEQGLQEIGVELGRKERDPVATAIAAGTGGLSEVVVPAIQAIRGLRQEAKTTVAREEVADAIKSIKPTTEAIEGVEQATGVRVGVFPAQQTQIPSELTKQNILPQLDAGSKIAVEALENQNKEVFEATTNLIDIIAPNGSIPTASKNFRTTAQAAITSAVKSRSEAVKPLYDAAFNQAKLNSDSVDLSPVIATANKELEKLVSDDPAAIAINSFLKRLQGEKVAGSKAGLIIGADGKPLVSASKGSVKPLSLDKLQSAKFTTDAAIDKSGGVILNSAQKNAKRILTQLEDIYVGQLGKLSPEFAAANKEFARLSGPIGALQDSVIGQVAKYSDTQLKNIAQTIFDPKSGFTDPTAILNAKKVINRVDPDAWNNLLRVEMNRRMGGIPAMAEKVSSGFTGNLPNEITRTLFGNKPQREALMSAMNKTQKQNFKYLETVLQKAGSGRAPGSPTAAFGQAIEKLKGVSLVVRDAIFKPLSTLQSVGERTLFDKNVDSLARVMFDPTFAPKVRALKALNPDSPAAARAMSQLLNDAGRIGGSSEQEDGSQASAQ